MTHRAHLRILALAAVVLTTSCGHNARSHQQVPPQDALSSRSSSAHVPRLRTNEVLRIARTALENAGYTGLENYPNVSCSYGIGQFKGKWVVSFLQVPPMPDDCFFVLVDDRTGVTCDVCRPGVPKHK
jgi:hypothetical protein